MIAWQNPVALWALPLAAIPIVIHLLRRHRAVRVPFPSLRFVRPSQTAAVRFSLPSDVVLMCLRVAVLALAVTAFAGPIALSESRLRDWNETYARAVVVDVSESMRAPGADGVTPEQTVADAADAETRSAKYATRLEAVDLAAGVRRAAAWLKTAPPARREVVVISDFQRGIFSESIARALPEHVGLRLVAVGHGLQSKHVAGVHLLGAGHVASRAQEMELSRDATSLTVNRLNDGASRGIRILPAGAQADALLRAVATAGSPAGSAEEPLAVSFGGNAPTGAATGLSPIRSAWMLQTLLRLQKDWELNGTTAAHVGSRNLGESEPWSVVLRDTAGRPLVAAAAASNELFLDVAASPDSYLAASIVRAALTARRPPADYREQEFAPIEDARLSSWNRRPSAVGASSLTRSPQLWRGADTTDARWCWATVLALLGAEQWLRGRSRRRADHEVSRAA
jgi:Aerotolerance regulator N-terminal